MQYSKLRQNKYSTPLYTDAPARFTAGRGRLCAAVCAGRRQNAQNFSTNSLNLSSSAASMCQPFSSEG